ncbi:O-antigen biosynthesis protein [Marinobacter nitratireducens]|uniref:O-antigen biosynthesis protein n=1 Tax=Marinobacter nitratireducens TaxID=1137280 RepID=A0A072N3Z5_9GAMM|nr:glycosyltransferase [Marinobacter nitratireducens]KEF31683.1 O-antigen biosynthesis protein [Marinobacter nitratireducens]
MSSEVSPDVSVSFVITAFKDHYLEAAIDSVFAQCGVSSFEILVLDDSPSKAVHDVVGKYDASIIRYIRSDHQLGGQLGLDYGVRLARGQYIKFLNDDDILEEGCTSRLIAALEVSGAKLATSKRHLIDDEGAFLKEHLFSLCPFDRDVLVKGRDLLEFLRVFPLNFIGEPSTVLARRRDLLGKFPHISSLNNRVITSVNDLAMYAGLLIDGDLAYLSEPLSRFRLHAGQSQRQGSAEVLGTTGREVLLSQFDAILGGEMGEAGTVRARPLFQSGGAYTRVPLRKVFQDAGTITDQALSQFSSLDRRREAIAGGRAEALNNWFGQRQLPAPLAKELGEKGSGERLCLVIVDEQPDRFGLNLSIAAFRVARYYCPSLSCVVLSPSPESYNRAVFQDVEFVGYESGALAGALNQVVECMESRWFTVSRTPAEITPQGALILMAELAEANEQIKAVYGDELIDRGGSTQSGLFRPGMNLDLLLSSPADMSRHWVFRQEYVVSVGGFRGEAGEALEFDLILRTLESEGFGSCGRMDEPLFLVRPDQQSYSLDPYMRAAHDHLERRGYGSAVVQQGAAAGTLRVRYGHPSSPPVSIIIPTKDQLHLLQTCIESILEKTTYPNYEVVIVDNNSETPEARAWLDGLAGMGIPNLRVLRYNKPFNFSAINNHAVREARGEYVLLLNNDTGIISPEWLDELMNHAQRPEVGIVGAKLLFPYGKVQHAGVVVGMRGPAEHVCIDAEANDPGYMNRLMIDQNYSAVTAACMLVRKSVYEQVGGLDEEAFAVSYNDIDFCLKVAQAGYLTVWTPYSQVMHVANASQTSVDKTADDKKVKRFQKEQETMFERWLPYMGNDPAFNRNLSLRASGFEVDHRVELNWQPQKLVGLPTILAHPADQWGCGHYRMIQPINSMREQAVAGGMVSFDWLSVPEMVRLDPDVLVYQRQITDQAVEHMQYAKRILKKPTVYELDDYLPNLPIKSAYRENMPKDILKSLRRSLKHVDRFVVSTEPLAEAFSGIHPDIQVIENCLPICWWSDLTSLRHQSEKPRVGWAGGMGHTGDLELVEAVVKELADEVDWVFFGMCPDGLRRFVKEVHEGIEISQYPRKLASLNLDLAIAPLEDNLFNRCKSNLRLLEYGACGFPVVCSDVEPYQAHELPVTRVKNRFKDWVDAIRMHLSDLDETARSGDRLQQVVRKNWMLEGENLRRWRDAWTKF